MEFTINKLGALVLAVLILVGIIIFVTTGVTEQTSSLNETTTNIIGNLTNKITDQK